MIIKLPHFTFLSFVVLDDDDSSITAGSIVTVTVTLKRTNLLDNYNSNSLDGKLLMILALLQAVLLL